jgi:hypothetical protein
MTKPKNRPELTAERLRELLSYDPDTGLFRWRISRRGSPAGEIAGCGNGDGYLRIKIDHSLCLAHRLAWLYVHGKWPVEQLDHISGVRADNRIANLREATNAQNHQNRAISQRNTSGHIGICWAKREKKWRARVTVNSLVVPLGYFAALEDAISARAKAKAELHQFQPFDREPAL